MDVFGMVDWIAMVGVSLLFFALPLGVSTALPGLLGKAPWTTARSVLVGVVGFWAIYAPILWVGFADLSVPSVASYTFMGFDIEYWGNGVNYIASGMFLVVFGLVGHKAKEVEGALAFAGASFIISFFLFWIIIPYFLTGWFYRLPWL